LWSVGTGDVHGQVTGAFHVIVWPGASVIGPEMSPFFGTK